MAEVEWKNTGGGYIGRTTAITGTTTNSYPATEQVEIPGAGKMLSMRIFVENTDGSNSLDYQIVIYPDLSAAKADAFLMILTGSSTEQTVGSGANEQIDISFPIEKVNVQLKTTSAGNHATFSVQVTGRIHRTNA